MEWKLRAYYSWNKTDLRKGCEPGGLAVEVRLKSESAVQTEVAATLRRTDIGTILIVKEKS